MQAAMMAKLPAIRGSLFLSDGFGHKGFPHKVNGSSVAGTISPYNSPSLPGFAHKVRFAHKVEGDAHKVMGAGWWHLPPASQKFSGGF
jgi:hypothetical protein